MSEDDTIDSASGALGIAMAAFAISINTLVVMSKQGLIAEPDLIEIMRRAQVLLKEDGGFPGDPDALRVAREGLELARQLFQTAMAHQPTGGPH